MKIFNYSCISFSFYLLTRHLTSALSTQKCSRRATRWLFLQWIFCNLFYSQILFYDSGIIVINVIFLNKMWHSYLSIIAKSSQTFLRKKRQRQNPSECQSLSWFVCLTIRFRTNPREALNKLWLNPNIRNTSHPLQNWQQTKGNMGIRM